MNEGFFMSVLRGCSNGSNPDDSELKNSYIDRNGRMNQISVLSKTIQYFKKHAKELGVQESHSSSN